MFTISEKHSAVVRTSELPSKADSCGAMLSVGRNCVKGEFMPRRTRQQRLALIAAAMLSVVCCAACDWSGYGYGYTNGQGMVLAPHDTISVYQLAHRLNMTVRSSSASRAVLSDSVNSVMMTAGPTARIYVNGSAIRHSSQIRPVGNILFVSPSAQSSIGVWLKHPVAEARPRYVRLGAGAETVSSSVGRAGSALGPVFIDAGHGGRDPGAISVNGVQEKTINLAVALQVAELLRERNVKVILTRSDDTFYELDERCVMSNRSIAAMFVSIHADSSTNIQARGCTVYVSRSASVGSTRLAEAISNSMASSGIISRGVHRADYRVLVGTTAPASLVELGFLSNWAEAAALTDRNYQRRLAEAIASGIVAELHRSAAAGLR